MGWGHEHHQLILTKHDGIEPGFGRLEGEHPEVEAALCHLGADLSGRHSPHVDVHERVRFAKSLDEGQDSMNGCLVGADEHPAPTQVAEILDGGLGLLGQAKEPLGVVAEQTTGVCERGVLGRPVEQPLADALLEPSDRLADRRLGAVELHGCPREAPLGGDAEEDAQLGQFHSSPPCGPDGSAFGGTRPTYFDGSGVR